MRKTQPVAPFGPDGLSASGIVHSYGTGPVLAGVDFLAVPGESVALTGPSGSGKTTLLHVLSGILVPKAGAVVHRRPGASALAVSQASAGQRAVLRRTDFGMVFQDGQLLGELTAAENVALPLLVGGVPASRAVPAACETLDQLGLGGLAHRRPGELSGGQAQRVAIARALVTGPAVLFADEPTGALDRRTGAQVIEVLVEVQRRLGVSLVVGTHDPELAERCDRVVGLRDGHVRQVEEAWR